MASEAVRAVDQLTQAWEDRVESILAHTLSRRQGRTLARRWAPRLPTIYRAGVAPESAASDVLALDKLESDRDRLVVTTKHEPALDDGPGITRVVFARGGPRVELAQAMPILTDLGLRVIEERTARLNGDGEYWIQDFGVLGPGGQPLDLDDVGRRLEACIDAIWEGVVESDSLNRLITCTTLGHERLEPLRAYRRYRQRLGSRYTEAFQTDVIVEHHAITEQLVRLFELKFGADDPTADRDVEAEEELRNEILVAIEAVSSLDHDRILRNQLHAIDATYRTNAYRPGRRALALKMRSEEVPAIPQPTPMWETYVHGLRVEGIHLRAGMIARGGIRWSERMDYRTEVLGLMRAQTVKNAVIVPTGAKGGFVLRGDASPSEPDALRDRVRAAYDEFVTALLDVADDLDQGTAVHPAGVRVLDGDDTYLVVAADKGTAMFSDIANRIAVDRGYWLGDAFASGGAEGYDHKALGITARGAWESVKRHFLDLGIDPESDPVTVAGIGDMSGDVFGNGLLQSKTIKLVAAYDHRHVFVDPRPRDSEVAWKERKRLFDTPGSSWDDYDRDLISAGGGVFPRSAKHVRITKAMRKALGIDAERLSPAELIQAVLRAPVDLLWNGGIGTVVKASSERDADAEDRASDSIRVDARDLRCRVVGEGGNLGFTQPARVEYARGGGRINADFIDNSAGVDCSDHEVNLKVLLDTAVRAGDLGADDRNELLRKATKEVVAHVLRGSVVQARLLTQEERRAPHRTMAAEELIASLEAEGGLDRDDHKIPSTDDLTERRVAGEGLSRPELAVLVALAKSSVATSLLDDERFDFDDSAWLADLERYFPDAIVRRVGARIEDHPLRRQLTATLAAGETINSLGPTFVARRSAEFGATPGAVVRAFRIAIGVIDARSLSKRIDELRDVDTDVPWELREQLNERTRVTSRWFLAHAADSSITATLDEHREGVKAIERRMARREVDEQRRERRDRWIAAGVPESLANALAVDAAMLLAPQIVAGSGRCGRPVGEVADAVLHLGEVLQMRTLHGAVAALAMPDRLTRWAVQALRDDLLEARVAVAEVALQGAPKADPVAAVDAFLAGQDVAVHRFRAFLRELSEGDNDHATPAPAACTLAVRQLQALGEAAFEY